MKIFVISDLHLTSSTNKPMDIFGGNWAGGYWEKIKKDWREKVSENDVVLIGGDISWAMTLDGALDDLKEIDELPGKKILIRGNHDYWWASMNKMQSLPLRNIIFIQNSAIKIEDRVFCGTRGWTVPEEADKQTEEDKKIFEREKIRLELTLSEASKLAQNGETIVCMMHYPPFNATFADSDFTEAIKKHNVSTVIYGHLHGNLSRYKDVVYKNGIPYYLTSCDFLNNKLLQIK